MTWQEFGVPDGKPVLYFHGGGSISQEAGLYHREAVQRNIRLIATNRPGAGGSSLCPGRPVAAYSDDLIQLLDGLRIDKFACLGESNGGMVTMAVAATMPARVLGAMPINPTVPWWSDPMGRLVSPRSVGVGYRLLNYPWLIHVLAKRSLGRARQLREEADRRSGGAFNRMQLIGPPPGTEPDVAEFHWQLGRAEHRGLRAELKWATSNWGFDYYAIPVRLDFFCGVYDAQAPFALVLADRNPNARFHYFSYGHTGFSHPDARRRFFDMAASYFEP
jgi:pimeloyl-ACP methyl ester carboxylesterase